MVPLVSFSPRSFPYLLSLRTFLCAFLYLFYIPIHNTVECILIFFYSFSYFLRILYAIYTVYSIVDFQQCSSLCLSDILMCWPLLAPLSYSALYTWSMRGQTDRDKEHFRTIGETKVRVYLRRCAAILWQGETGVPAGESHTRVPTFPLIRSCLFN